MPILPPIAPIERNNAAIDPALIVVYLPIETPAKIEQFLQPFKHQHFAIYHPDIAGAVAQWLTEGNYSSQSIETLSARLWRHSRLPQQALFSAAEIDSMVNSVVAQVYVLLVT